MVRFLLLVILLGVPIAEVAVFLMVGSIIGALPPIALIILTAVLGATLLRSQGLSALRQMQDDLPNARVPAAAMGNAVTIAIAGILLLTPGFITDFFGLLLFIPAVRSRLWRKLSAGVHVEQSAGVRTGPEQNRRPRTHSTTIELGDDDYRAREGDQSPWTEPPSR